MSFLKSIAGHTRLGNNRYYLEKKNRCLAHDFINFGVGEEEHWDKVMDEVTHELGNDSKWKGKRARTYEHFIISPDPEDNVSLELLRELATSWAEKKFGIDGEHGSFLTKISYHQDNANSVMHAHLTVCCSNLNNGKRLQLSNADVMALSRDLQILAKEKGLHHFDPDVYINQKAVKKSGRLHLPSKQPIYKTKTERAIEEEGKLTWKQELRDYIEIASQLSTDIDSFQGELEKFGIKSIKKNGDILFYHPSAETRKVYGRTLGANYTIKGIESRIDLSYYQRLAKEDQNTDSVYSHIVDVQKTDKPVKGISLNDISVAFATINKYSIQNLNEGYARLKAESTILNKLSTNDKRFTSQSVEVERIKTATKVITELELLPLNESSSKTKPKDWKSLEQQKLADRSGKVSLDDKIKHGWRLSKSEYSNLSEAQKKSWSKNRKKAKQGKIILPKKHSVKESTYSDNRSENKKRTDKSNDKTK